MFRKIQEWRPYLVAGELCAFSSHRPRSVRTGLTRPIERRASHPALFGRRESSVVVEAFPPLRSLDFVFATMFPCSLLYCALNVQVMEA